MPQDWNRGTERLGDRTASFACHTHLLHKVTLTNGSFEIEAEDVEYKWTPLLAVRPLAPPGILRWDEKVDPRSRIALSYR